jgi:hypothetical protein
LRGWGIFRRPGGGNAGSTAGLACHAIADRLVTMASYTVAAHKAENGCYYNQGKCYTGFHFLLRLIFYIVNFDEIAPPVRNLSAG